MIIVGIDQARRNTGVVVYHLNKVYPDEWKIYSFTITTEVQELTKVNEVIFCYNNFVKEFEKFVYDKDLQERFNLDKEKYLGIEAPLESVSYGGRRSNKFMGNSSVTNNSLAQYFILILSYFLRREFKCLQFHPNYTRSFFGGNRKTGKGFSLEKGKEWLKFYGDKWIPLNLKSPINNHVAEATLFVMMVLRLLYKEHPAIPKDDYYKLTKFTSSWQSSIDDWYINFTPDVV